jgi:transposase
MRWKHDLVRYRSTPSSHIRKEDSLEHAAMCIPCCTKGDYCSIARNKRLLPTVAFRAKIHKAAAA